MKLIETLSDWLQISAELSERGYRIWQTQYYTDSPEGFHARFWATGRPDVEIVTHSNEVYKAIMQHK